MFRFGLVVGSIAVAAISHAQISLLLSSHGTAVPGGLGVQDTESVDYQFGGLGALSTLNYTFDSGTGFGNGSYTGAGGVLDFDIDFTSESFSPSGVSFSGFWDYTGGTGTYAGLGGDGTLSSTFLLTGAASAVSSTGFQGALTPEPSPYAALGVGLVGLLIRRKKKC